MSRSHKSKESENYLKDYDIEKINYIGSSYKFCLIASGEADIYPRMSPTCEWDTAAGHAILKGCCDYDATRLKSLQLRFSSPVYPGETVRTEIWQDGKDISFKSKIVERDVVVLDNGRATVEN